MKEKNAPDVKTFFTVWLALMLLLILTVASTYLPIGHFHVVANIGIAAVKMLLVILFFMHIWYRRSLIRFVSFTAFFWIILLLGLTLVDYLTRPIITPPW